MKEFKLTLSNVAADVRSFWTVSRINVNDTAFGRIERAATLTMRAAGNLLKTRGRADIRAGGLGTRFANAWRVDVYPKRDYSVDAAVYGYHAIPYSGIFENGGTITAKRGLLWLPLPTVPKVGRRIARPRDLTGVKLFSINNGTGKPLLAAKIRNKGVNRNSRIRGQVSLPALRAGTNAEKIRETSRLKAKQRGRVRASDAKANIVTVPLFVGVPSVTLRRRFNLTSVANKVANELPALYEQYAPND